MTPYRDIRDIRGVRGIREGPEVSEAPDLTVSTEYGQTGPPTTAPEHARRVTTPLGWVHGTRVRHMAVAVLSG